MTGSALEGSQRILFDALMKRGASFTQRLSGLLNDKSPYDALMGLMAAGLVCSDSFVPVRQMLNKERLEKATVKQRVSARVSALTTGRWELSRPAQGAVCGAEA